MTKAIEIKNLRKTYADGTVALKGIDLQIEAGDFFALLGANGAGKTTVIGILTGLVNKTSGSIDVFGSSIDSAHIQAKKLMGVVPQEMNFNQFEKVFDIVVNEAGYFGIEKKEAQAEAERLLKQLELWEKRNQPSRNLSGGMKRRLMIARALVTKPKLLILDEPTAGVDVELRHSMWEYLKKLNQQGLTILLTTHYLEEVEQLCKKAAMIKDGVIIKNDYVKNLINLVDEETFIVHADHIQSLHLLEQYHPKQLDEHTIEIDLDKNHELNQFVLHLAEAGIKLKDIRPKGNRIEKLFLSLLDS